MEHELRNGLSIWSIMAIVCNSVVGFLIVILFVILYKACKVPSHQEKVPCLSASLLFICLPVSLSIAVSLAGFPLFVSHLTR
uniref:Uncharacterized protein n=1 Tax=Neolamprologus brichardi TaxID=32507 RepID=A0A3Q4IEL7_NEOBR